MTPAALHDALKQRFGERSNRRGDRLNATARTRPITPGFRPRRWCCHLDRGCCRGRQPCRAHKAPDFFGTGTSLEGHINAIRGGISLDLSLMTEVLEVNERGSGLPGAGGRDPQGAERAPARDRTDVPDRPRCRCLAGRHDRDPASGTNAVRYGTMKDNVLELTVVMANGDVVRTGGRAPKSSAGYDLTRLMIGSEGTLGVITEIQLKLYGQPEAVSAAVCLFPDIDAAAKTAIMVKQMGIPVARMELVDGASIRAINEADQLGMVEKPHIFFEFHGTEAWVAEQAERTQEIAAELGGEDFEWSTRPEDRTRLWNARHNMFYSVQRMRPGSAGWPTDVCVPISPGWRTASTRRSRTSARPTCLRRWSGTSGTATFTCST